MFHLYARVHLQKEKLVALVVKDELHRAGILITDASRQGRCGMANLIANVCGYRIGGSFLDYFLMTPLQRTVTLAQMNNISGAVTQNLDFNMPGVADVPFHVKRVIAEGRAGFCGGGAKDSRHLARIPDQLDATATATGRGLEQHRIADLFRLRDGFLPIFGVIGSRHPRCAARSGSSTPFRPAGHLGHSRGAAPEKSAAVTGAGLGKLASLG